MEFIDKAFERRRIRPGAEKLKQKAEIEGTEQRDLEIREQVDQLITTMILPLVCQAQKKLEEHGCKAEVDLEISRSIGTDASYCKGVKLQLDKGLDRSTGIPMVIGSSVYFSASPPYSTTVAIVAYGADNSAVFSDRFDMTEMTEKVVVDHIRMFVQSVIR